MSKLLLPYGAKKNSALAAKLGGMKSARAAGPKFLPYGASDNGDLVAKVGAGQTKVSAAGARRVVRRIAD